MAYSGKYFLYMQIPNKCHPRTALSHGSNRSARKSGRGPWPSQM